MRFRVIIFLLLTVVGCSQEEKEAVNNLEITTQGEDRVVTTPTRILAQKEWPKIYDDLNHEGMLTALDRQIKKFQRIRSSTKIQLGSITYDYKVFLRSLEKYRELVMDYRLCEININMGNCEARFKQKLYAYFHMFAPLENGKIKAALFTAYHTPKIMASLERTEKFNVGIHSRPEEDHLRYFTRNEINFENALSNTPYELMYMEDQYEQYLLHIQGGGKVVYTDASGATKAKYLNYDNTNRKSFRFISRYMIDKGYINNPSVAAQREYLKQNPHKQREIYDYSPSYVYFKLSEEPPHGSDATSLTDNRSIATDYRIYKLKGLLTYVTTERPIKDNGKVKWLPMHRFMIDHDTGGAIKGVARGDLYFGEDEYAAWVATQMKNNGFKYFLAIKPEFL